LKRKSKEMNMNYITERLGEKASHGGLGLVAVGLIILFLGSWVNIAAYAAIAFGAYQFLTRG
tara:strand:- start:692 stop:877 length:186 start_codon:yes stop_codon:yes gene_type:complete